MKTLSLTVELAFLTFLVWVSVNKAARQGYREEAYRVGRELGL
jgi:hypothetical protein